jgi:hypothetical protein
MCRSSGTPTCNVNNTQEAVFSLPKEFNVFSQSRRHAKVIPLCDIAEFLLKTRLYHVTALELFLTDESTVFVNFPDVHSLSVATGFRILDSPHTPGIQVTDCREFFASRKITKRLLSRAISNFQPRHIPWVIRDFHSSQ